jgi:DNA-binding PadR family transcriptional regulator
MLVCEQRRGGMRTVYLITPRGRDRFRELLHAQCAARRQPSGQNARLAEIRKLHRQWVTMLPTGSRHLMQHMEEQYRLDLRWLRAVLADGGQTHSRYP